MILMGQLSESNVLCVKKKKSSVSIDRVLSPGKVSATCAIDCPRKNNIKI